MKTLVSSRTGPSGTVEPSIGSDAGGWLAVGDARGMARRCQGGIELYQQVRVEVGKRAPAPRQPGAELVLGRQRGQGGGDDDGGRGAASATRRCSEETRRDLGVHVRGLGAGGEAQLLCNVQCEGARFTGGAGTLGRACIGLRLAGWHGGLRGDGV